jgi:thiosulfate dehydrogenase
MLSPLRWLLLALAAVSSASAPLVNAPLVPTTPELSDLPPGRTGVIIRYGFELLADTPKFIGPEGVVGKYTRNRLACRNCHMDVGMRPFGNSWLDTHALYPQYRTREGKVQTLAERVNACLVHNLLGKPLPVDGREMTAILLYYRWLGKGRPLPEKDTDSRLVKLELLSRAASPAAGKKVFEDKCTSCHGTDGQGRLNADGVSYLYPPLWGEQSFMSGASLSRLSLLARFVKGNMPLGSTAEQPQLSDDDSWDVAAFVLSHKRPVWREKAPFPFLAEKPYDFPFGPYADPFPLEQHQYGPFRPIVDYWTTRQGTRAAETTLGI